MGIRKGSDTLSVLNKMRKKLMQGITAQLKERETKKGGLPRQTGGLIFIRDRSGGSVPSAKKEGKGEGWPV